MNHGFGYFILFFVFMYLFISKILGPDNSGIQETILQKAEKQKAKIYGDYDINIKYVYIIIIIIIS